jgi:hypothetical protein
MITRHPDRAERTNAGENGEMSPDFRPPPITLLLTRLAEIRQLVDSPLWRRRAVRHPLRYLAGKQKRVVSQFDCGEGSLIFQNDRHAT